MSKNSIHLTLTFLFIALLFISGCNERYGAALICLVLVIYFMAQLSSFTEYKKPRKSFIDSCADDLNAFEEMVGKACVRIELSLIQAWRRLTRYRKSFTNATGKPSVETIPFHE